MSHPRGGDFRRSAASPSLSPGRGPLPPPRDRVSAGMTRLAYVLMHDKKGWSSLAHQAQYLRYVCPTKQRTFPARIIPCHVPLRTQPPGVSDVDVEKGTLVEVDPDGDFDPRTNISVNVVSLDHPEVRVSLLMKELLPIEEGVFQRLIPLRPSERYSVMTDDRRGRMLAAGVGDTVYCVTSSRYKEVGMVQYVGPLRGVKGGGIFYGVELLVRNKIYRFRSFSLPNIDAYSTYANRIPGTATLTAATAATSTSLPPLTAASSSPWPSSTSTTTASLASRSGGQTASSPRIIPTRSTAMGALPWTG